MREAHKQELADAWSSGVAFGKAEREVEPIDEPMEVGVHDTEHDEGRSNMFAMLEAALTRQFAPQTPPGAKRSRELGPIDLNILAYLGPRDEEVILQSRKVSLSVSGGAWLRALVHAPPEKLNETFCLAKALKSVRFEAAS